MKTILLIIFLSLCTLTYSETCHVDFWVYDPVHKELITQRAKLTFHKFSNKEEALEYAKDHHISEKNIVREKDTICHSVWNHLPETNFVCVEND